jgi:hypothetical protein
MNKEELEDELDNWKSVQYRINDEGMEYCFRSYSEFREIEDNEFHLKRKNLINLMKEMENYVTEKIKELENQINQ